MSPQNVNVLLPSSEARDVATVRAAKTAAQVAAMIHGERPQPRRAVGAKLGGTRTVNRSAGGTYVIRRFEPRKARRYLLTGGIAVCGVCDHPLIGSNKWRKSREPWPYYFCHPKVGGKACVGTEAEPLERHVRAELLARIDSDPEFLEQLAVDDHAAERDQILRELAGLDERRAELSRLWALGERSSEEWAAAREVLDEQQARLNIRLGELPAPAEHAVDLTALPTAWPNMTLDELELPRSDGQVGYAA
jgi:site-specific DNA recombinase